MDSGSSSSMQSSSGGEEEYDSRADSQISPFLNPSSRFISISNQHQHPQSLSLHGNQSPTFFDIPPQSSLNLIPFSQSQTTNPIANSQYNLDFVSSTRGLRSDSNNYTEFGKLTAFPSLSPLATAAGPEGAASSRIQVLIGAQGLNQGPFRSSSSLRSDHQSNMAKNPKKRIRASRRAPTTVLTTDISNFRQMVQEFTGIPTSPFSPTTPYSRRFDLFGHGSSTMRSSSHLDTMGSLYLRQPPSAQKVQLSPLISSSDPPLLSSSMVDAIPPSAAAAAAKMNSTNSYSFAGNSNSYQLPFDVSIPTQLTKISNHLQNSVLPFQSLLQSPLPRGLIKQHSLGKAPIFNTKSQVNFGTTPSLGNDLMSTMSNESMNANNSGFPSQENSGFPSQESSHGLQERNATDNSNQTRSWRDNEGSMSYGDQQQLGSLSGGNGNPTHARGYMLNCSASTSDFHP